MSQNTSENTGEIGAIGKHGNNKEGGERNEEHVLLNTNFIYDTINIGLQITVIHRSIKKRPVNDKKQLFLVLLTTEA